MAASERAHADDSVIGVVVDVQRFCQVALGQLLVNALFRGLVQHLPRVIHSLDVAVSRTISPADMTFVGSTPLKNART